MAAGPLRVTLVANTVTTLTPGCSLEITNGTLGPASTAKLVSAGTPKIGVRAAS